MKKLYVIRHAKSSWKDYTLDDWERPLNKRGKRNIPEMGEFLKQKKTYIELFISSHAVRALKTAKGIAKSLDYSTKSISITPDLYHAGTDDILEVLASVDDSISSVAIFGHNPGFTMFVNELTKSDIDNVPTCGVCAISVKVDNWQDIKEGCGILDYFMYPKAL
ncbi:MAG: histidine phosphatase family protein [Cyclobacteriaceae bacterium]